jgi:hypothetical protein
VIVELASQANLMKEQVSVTKELWKEIDKYIYSPKWKKRLYVPSEIWHI